MINCYSFTHPAIEGEITFEYQHGLLVKYSLNGSMHPKALLLMFQTFPFNEEQINTFSKTGKVKEVPPDLSFETFWNKYNHKVAGSNRSLVQKIWNALPDKDKHAAFAYLPKYDGFLKISNTPKKYAETYLRSRLFDN
jgi:hypothetical protein